MLAGTMFTIIQESNSRKDYKYEEKIYYSNIKEDISYEQNHA